MNRQEVMRWVGAWALVLAMQAAWAGPMPDGDGAGALKSYSPESGLVAIGDSKAPLTPAAQESLQQQLILLGWRGGGALMPLVAKFTVVGGVIQTIQVEADAP